jgi:hypothetical protein
MQYVERLLSSPFPGVDSLRQQLPMLEAKTENHGDMLAITFAPRSGLAAATVRGRVPVEAEGIDADGEILHFLLHVRDGVLAEVEIFREDGGEIREFPLSSSLSVTTN